MPDDELQGFREREFWRRIEPLLSALLGAVQIISAPRLEGGLRPDFIAILSDGSSAIIELKAVTPTTQLRLDAVVDQLQVYGDAYKVSNQGRQAKLVLVVPGTLSEEHRQYLQSHGIDQVIDDTVFREASELLHASDSDFFQTSEETDVSTNALLSGAELLHALDSVLPGRPAWFEYQRLCGRILEALFVPPLELPISERSNETGVNRRDFILPNYTVNGFWNYMRSYYEAHYVVVDAKNWVRAVEKREVLQLANYLSPHGPGLFAMIMSRNGCDRGAEITQREQWAFNKKMIMILNDSDVRQMIALSASGQDPAELIRQKIEDFRLAY